MAQEPRLFNPARQAIEDARKATRRARERNLTAVPTPSALRSPSLSQGRRTVGAMPRGGVPADFVPAHGTRARYNSRRYGCRCNRCRGANNAYMARYRHGDDHEPLASGSVGQQALSPGRSAGPVQPPLIR